MSVLCRYPNTFWSTHTFFGGLKKEPVTGNFDVTRLPIEIERVLHFESLAWRELVQRQMD